MATKKIFIMTIALSLAAHIVALGLVGFLAHTGDTDTEEGYTVTFEKHPERTAAAREEEQEPKARLEDTRSRARGGSVDTVDLDNTETRYYPYLLQVKERIDREWSYPEDSFSRGEVGTTVVEFSIAREGGLAACRAIASSGHPSLDAESLRAIRSAAPFAPLSEEFGLARLNIVAKFRYTLAD